MLKEFRDFAARGNVIDLAIGVIIGAAFGKVVTSVVNDLIMPPIGMNVFVINSLAKDVPLWTIYKGVTPFILSDFVRLAILVAFPWLSLVLPGMMR